MSKHNTSSADRAGCHQERSTLDKVASRNPEEFYDNSVIQDLVSDGFVEKVAKRAK